MPDRTERVLTAERKKHLMDAAKSIAYYQPVNGAPLDCLHVPCNECPFADHTDTCKCLIVKIRNSYNYLMGEQNARQN